MRDPETDLGFKPNVERDRRDAASGVRRVAIVHFTAQPAIGGIESLISHQCQVLQSLGHTAVGIVGHGTTPSGTQTIRIPLMDPNHAAVTQSRSSLGDTVPEQDHPLVRQLLTELEPALTDCTDCWVQNALTVSLNPFLTVALMGLIARNPRMRWVGWTADLSSTSRFVDTHAGISGAEMQLVQDRVNWVAISRARRDELHGLLGLAPEQIQIVNPPLDVLTWLEVGHQTRLVVERLDLLRTGPVVLVPAKALPHKGLDRAVRVGIVLAKRCPAARVLITAAPSPHEPRISAAMVRRLRTSIQGASANAAVTLLPDLIGEVSSDRTVRELMQLCDVVLVPSLEEGFGMPLREAAALGVPVVCTDIPVFREAAQDCATFYGETVGDWEVASLVLAASQARRNPARRAALASMIQFTAEVKRLLHLTSQPKV